MFIYKVGLHTNCFIKYFKVEKKLNCLILIFIADKETRISPRFAQLLDDHVAADSETVILECQVSGSPEPKITWSKDGKELKPSVDFHQSYDGVVAKLEIDGVYPEDAGLYECCAKNEMGEERSSCILRVEGIMMLCIF